MCTGQGASTQAPKTLTICPVSVSANADMHPTSCEGDDDDDPHQLTPKYLVGK